MSRDPRESEALAILASLVWEVGLPRLLHLIATVAEERADEFQRQGASLQTARFSREARILRQASEALLAADRQ